MVVTLCHSAMTTVPPVVVAGSALYVEPARSMPALAEGDGDPAALSEGAPAEAGALADGAAVPPQAPATNIAAASMVKIRLRIKSPPPNSGTTTWPSRVGSRGVDARQAVRWDRRTESHRAMRASQAVTHVGRNNADGA